MQLFLLLNLLTGRSETNGDGTKKVRSLPLEGENVQLGENLQWRSDGERVKPGRESDFKTKLFLLAKN